MDRTTPSSSEPPMAPVGCRPPTGCYWLCRTLPRTTDGQKCLCAWSTWAGTTGWDRPWAPSACGEPLGEWPAAHGGAYAALQRAPDRRDRPVHPDRITLCPNPCAGPPAGRSGARSRSLAPGCAAGWGGSALRARARAVHRVTGHQQHGHLCLGALRPRGRYLFPAGPSGPRSSVGFRTDAR